MQLHICSVLWSIHNPLSLSVGTAAYKEATTAPSNSSGSGRCLVWFLVWTSNTLTTGLWGFTQSAQTARSFQILSQLLVINYPTSEHHTARSAAKFLTQTTTQPAHLQETSVQRSHYRKYCSSLSGVSPTDVIHWHITCLVFLSINKLMLVYLLLPLPVPFSTPQIPHGLTWHRTRASRDTGWLLTAWAMAQFCDSWKCLIFSVYRTVSIVNIYRDQSANVVWWHA